MRKFYKTVVKVTVLSEEPLEFRDIDSLAYQMKECIKRGEYMRNKPIRIYLEIPVKVITPLISRNRQDSIFYAGKNIAETQYGNRTYVLTTAGEYNFSLKKGGKILSERSRKVVKALTDSKINRLDRNDLVENWGWFGINIWIEGQCLPYPMDVYSRYEEAMQALKEYVKKDLLNRMQRGTI